MHDEFYSLTEKLKNTLRVYLGDGVTKLQIDQMAVSVKEDCWDPEILLLWWRDVTLILSKNKFYSQSQYDAEPVADRRMLHVTWPGVNCII